MASSSAPRRPSRHAPAKAPAHPRPWARFPARALVKNRPKFEDSILDPKFRLLRSVFAMLNERVARIQFKKVSNNRAKFLTSGHIRAVQIESEIDRMFECLGVLLSQGSQRFFTRVIRMLRPKPHRKSTFINLDQIPCSVQEISKYTPSDETIWRSIRSVTLQRLTREFFYTTRLVWVISSPTLIHCRSEGDAMFATPKL